MQPLTRSLLSGGAPSLLPAVRKALFPATTAVLFCGEHGNTLGNVLVCEAGPYGQLRALLSKGWGPFRRQQGFREGDVLEYTAQLTPNSRPHTATLTFRLLNAGPHIVATATMPASPNAGNTTTFKGQAGHQAPKPTAGKRRKRCRTPESTAAKKSVPCSSAHMTEPRHPSSVTPAATCSVRAANKLPAARGSPAMQDDMRMPTVHILDDNRYLGVAS